MNSIKNLRPFKKFCLYLGSLPSAYLESMTYYEALTYVIKYLEREVIPTVNNNSDVVKELQDFVTHYFDNLDVQEEINNKLDDMASQGQLAEIIAQYLQIASVLAFDTVEDMSLSQNLIDGSTCKTLGLNEYNDGLGSFYKIRTRGEEETADGINLVDVYDTDLIAEKIYNNIKILDIKSIGAVGDGETDDTTAITNGLNILKESGGILYFPKGTYIIGSIISIPSNVTLKGIKGASIIKASDDWDTNNASVDYKSMIKNEYTAMEYSGNTTSNIVIENLTLDNNGQQYAGNNGVIHFRGVRYGKIENVEINLNGENNWGIIIFSSNKHININNVSIKNTSDDNSLGGCLWIRSGLNVTSDDMKTYDVNVTNSYFSSTAKDELVVIADGISGGWTEANISNCTLNGIATTNYSSYLMVINSVYNTSYVKANINNINLRGNCLHYGIVAGYSGINDTCVDLVASNININLDHGNGIRSYSRDKYIFSNCNITINDGNYGAHTITISNSYSNKNLYGCNVNNCNIINLTGRCCEDCPIITNSILKSGTYAIHTFGGSTSMILNNIIWSNDYGIHLQTNGTVGSKNSIVSGNYIRRLTESDNTGSVALFAPYATKCSFSNNRFLVLTGATTGTSIGFNTWYNLSNSSGCILPEESTVTYV